MWAKYENLYTSFVGQYFEGDCDVKAVTMAILKSFQKNLQSLVLPIVWIDLAVCDACILAMAYLGPL